MRPQVPAAVRQGFTARLQQAMAQAGVPCSATALTRLFNAHYTGRPLSVHGCRRWLIGSALPVADKLTALAAALGVEQGWLLFGRAAGAPAASQALPATLSALLGIGLQLPEHDHALLLALAKRLARNRPATSYESDNLKMGC